MKYVTQVKQKSRIKANSTTPKHDFLMMTVYFEI